MGSVASAVGGLFGQTAQAFTPQNQYQYQTGGQNIPALLGGTQASNAQNTNSENSLAQQLLAQSQGQGPNPAQMQLQNALTQNQQQAAGEVASQKGINPGLAQKQIMTNSANQAQQAAGQGALLGAQQQLAAQNQLGGLYGNIANQNIANQGQYENVLTGQNNTNAGVAQSNAAANQNTTGGLLGAVGGGIQSLMSPAAAAGGSTAAAGGLSAGGGEAADLGLMAAAHGGEIPDMHKMMAMIHGGPGLHPGHPVMMALKAAGGMVPGDEVVPGDSPQNDNVPAMLSAGEGVLPKTVMQSNDPGEAAKSFVNEIQKKKKKGEGGYAQVLAAKRKVS